jgi:hypothetical protein
MTVDHVALTFEADIPLTVLCWIVETFGTSGQGRWQYLYENNLIKFKHPADLNFFLLKWS